MRLDFTNTPTSQILSKLQTLLKKQNSVTFTVLNPDIKNPKLPFRHRGYKSWTSAAEILFCSMKTPYIIDEIFVEITFEKLDMNSSFHTQTLTEEIEKYGTDSTFFQINKMQEPSFVYPYEQALKNVQVQTRRRILNLGINKGDEFQAIKEYLDPSEYDNLSLIGIDYSKSAINFALQRFKEHNVQLITHDINELEQLNLEPFDLIISIGTLQSASHNFKTYFMHLVQNYLKKDGSMILGFPNCRWIDNEMIYGAKAPNYNYSEQSILYNDVMFCKKYLQQKKYRVTLTGKEYLFLTATSINKNI